MAEYGGGIYLSSSFPAVTNCIIADNIAEWGGGIYCDTSLLTITNSTITTNVASSGGGLYCHSGTATIENTIFWADVAHEGPEMWIGTDASPSSIAVSYSDVQGGEEAVYAVPPGSLDWQEGNLDLDPLFVDEVDFRLGDASPCIDAGDPDSSFDDQCLPPSRGTGRNDIGAYGGPDVCCWNPDIDGDGYAHEVCGGDDCDDGDPQVNPGIEEGRLTGTCSDGLDNDCDGLADETDPGCEAPCFIGITIQR